MARKRNIYVPVRFSPEEHAEFKQYCELFGFKESSVMRRSTMEYLKQLKWKGRFG